MPRPYRRPCRAGSTPSRSTLLRLSHVLPKLYFPHATPEQIKHYIYRPTLLPRATYSQKLFGDQSRAANQPTVDIRLGEQLGRIGSFYTAAVQYNQTLRDLVIID